ncbi:tyrosine-type recombinase/integrase [Thermoproteota archaeon]
MESVYCNQKPKIRPISNLKDADSGPSRIRTGDYRDVNVPNARELLQKLDNFNDVCLVDLRLKPRTATKHRRQIRKFLEWVGDSRIDKDSIRAYFKTIESPNRYEHALNAQRRFFRDYLNQEELIQGFRHPYRPFTPNIIPSKDEVRNLYKLLPTSKMKAYYLLIASSGLRKSEILSLNISDIDFDQRMIIPRTRSSSKHTWISFYNEEAELALREYLGERTEGKLFTWGAPQWLRDWKQVKSRAETWITSKKLRMWFCSEMSTLGLPDRYVDAFCGRTPKSVLARHYTDFNNNRLKEIYDKASLTILA